jgi:hypothetical protein
VYSVYIEQDLVFKSGSNVLEFEKNVPNLNWKNWTQNCTQINLKCQNSCHPLLDLFGFILISWGCLTSPTFFFCNEPIWLGHSQKKVETMEAPQNRRFYWKMGCLSFWPTYIGDKGRTLGKTCGIKARYYWQHPWGTHWEPREHIGNLMGTHWELERNEGKMKRVFDSKSRVFYFKEFWT